MATTKNRAKLTQRVMIQMSRDLEAGLRTIADREYDGNVQWLVRECLQSRVDGNAGDGDRMAEVLQALDQLRQEAAGHNRELSERLDRVQEQVAELSGAMAVHLTGMQATRKGIQTLAKELAETSRALEPLQDIRDGVKVLIDGPSQVKRDLAQMKATLDNLEKLLLEEAAPEERGPGLGSVLRKWL